MNSSWYTTQIFSHLYTSTYERIGSTDLFYKTFRSSDILDLYKKISNDICKNDNKVKINFFLYYINEKQFIIPPFYIIPKIHKLPYSSRPISASHSFFSTPLAIYVASKLQKIAYALPNICKDSQSLINKINKLYVPSHAILFSLDITALYPNINAINSYPLLKQEIIKFYNNNNAINIYKGLVFLLENHYTSFRNIVYKQNIGTAMGVPPAPPYANIFINALFKPIVDKYHSNLLLYTSYIDDIFGIWLGNESTLREFIAELNNQAASIKIPESSISISKYKVQFLDIEIIHRPHQTKLSYKPYGKPNNPYLYIPFNSQHPTACRKGWIRSEYRRLATHSSSKSFFNKALIKFQLFLINRGYNNNYIKEITRDLEYKTLHLVKSKKYTNNELNTHILTIHYSRYTKNINANKALEYYISQEYLCDYDRSFIDKRILRAFKNHNSIGKLLIHTHN